MQRSGIDNAAGASLDSSSGSTALCTMRVHGTVSSPPLNIWVKDEGTGAVSDFTDTSDWEAQPWDRSATGDEDGTIFTGRVKLGSATHPGAIYIAYVGPHAQNALLKAAQLSRVYVTDVKVTLADSREVVFSAHSFVNAVHTEYYGHRVFFKEDALLPNQTPDALVEDRQLDLDIVKGIDKIGRSIAGNVRQPADRIEDYDVYNDLGNSRATRPVLGGSQGMLQRASHWYPYPRRMRTNRGLNSDGITEKGTFGLAYVPADDDFDRTKNVSFLSSGGLAVIPLVVEQLTRAAAGLSSISLPEILLGGLAILQNPPKAIASGRIGGFWKSYDEMIQIYDNSKPTPPIVVDAMLGNRGSTKEMSTDDKDEQTRKMLRGLSAADRQLVLQGANINPNDFAAPEKIVKSSKFKDVRQTVNDKLDWPEPLVYRGQHTPKNATDYDGTERHDSWSSDEEFGRQYKAGINPFVLAAFKSFPKEKSILQDNRALIEGRMEGNTIEGLMSQAASGAPPRIFVVDYEKHIAECARTVNAMKEDRCLYAGRCIMYQRNDQRLVPVAIELHAPQTSASKLVLYTPSDPPEVWQLAKAAFNTIDSGFHQLVSHWLRTHCAVEPYIIATDRNLSQMHPVYKLLQPHLQYTCRINADARSLLVAANTVIELLFTTGTESMQLSSRVYSDWKFKDQAFPQDVISRGLAKATGDGGLEIIAEDHPWCEDGLLIWNALSSYVSNYIGVYYTSDEDVKEDVEIGSWWSEIKNKGHADAHSSGWPPLETRADLALILATITWTTSAHHASVNFGQHDYGSFLLNRSCLLRKPIPEKGSNAYKALTDPKTNQEEFLTYLASQLPACINIAVLQILATHSENENYISDSKQKYISGEKAVAVHAKLLEDLKAAEKEIAVRNTNGISKARTVSEGGLPYQLLIPSGTDVTGKPLSTDGPTGERTTNRPGRGISFSVSI